MDRITFYKEMIRLLKKTPDEEVKRKQTYLCYMRYQLKMLSTTKEYEKLNVIFHGKSILSFD